MNNNYNLNKICKIIWQLEKDYNLLDLEIQEVKVWQYWRNEIYFSIIKEKGLWNQVHPDLERQTVISKLLNILNTVKYSLSQNPFTYNKEVEAIIIPHQRVKKVGMDYIDIYTNYLIEKLEESCEYCFILEKPYSGKHLAKRSNNKKYIEYINLKAFINRQFLKLSFTQEELEQLEKVNSLIINNFGINLKLNKLFIKLIKRFKTKYELYKKLFLKLNPKKLYLTINYSNMEAIKAAKDLGLEVIEIQHGQISEVHLGYSYPNYTEGLDYFPDKFYCWGKYWSETTHLPLKEENIINYGFQYFRKVKANYNSTNKIANQIVVISQGGIADSLSELLLNHIGELKGYEIIYKLHPSQFNSINNNIEKLSGYSNVKIVKDEDLYKILGESKYLIGSFSTAIYEGIAFNCKPIIANLPGIEYIESLIQRYNIPVMDSGSNISAIINLANDCNIDTSEFF